MKLNKNLVLLIILIYPLLIGLPFIQAEISHALNIYYFTIPFFILCLVLIAFGRKTVLHAQELTALIFLILLIARCVVSMELTFPIVFFAVVFTSIISFNNLYGVVSKRMIYIVVILYLIVSLVAFLNPANFAMLGRFSGFTVTASTYSTFLTAVYIIYYCNSKHRLFTKSILFLFFLALIVLSETRLNTMLFLLLPFIFWTHSKQKIRFIGLLLFVVALNLIYPIYALVSQESKAIATLRYEDGRDASFQLRYALFSQVWEDFLTLPFLEKLFGAGPETARALIKNAFVDDHMPHQDFVRLLYDFGILGFVAFMILLFKKMLRNKTTYALGYLYFISFFHNMVFSLFIVLLLLFFASKSFNEMPDEDLSQR